MEVSLFVTLAGYRRTWLENCRRVNMGRAELISNPDRPSSMATATDVGGMIPKVFVEGSMYVLSFALALTSFRTLSLQLRLSGHSFPSASMLAHTDSLLLLLLLTLIRAH